MPGALRVLCVAPGEWMLVSAEPLTGDFVERIAADARAQGAVLIDGTDGMGVLRVQGAHAREVLSKGCGLDFHPDAFPVGRCARTRFAQIPLLIEHIDAGPTFHCYVARSYLRYLVDWIEDAAVEFDPSPLLGYRP